MLKKLSTLWRFLLPVLLLLSLGILVLIGQQASQQLHVIQQGAQSQAESLSRLFSVTDSLVSQQVSSAMMLLKQRGEALGSPSIRGSVTVNDLELPNLVLGNTAVADSNQLVDGVTAVLGGSATIFVKSGDLFYRISTNVKQPNSNRAIGTVLDNKGKVIKAISQGKAFQGMVNILGEPYISRYEPLLDGTGKLIGIWYVGYKVDMQVIRKAVEKSRYLSNGFVTVLDDDEQIRFASAQAPTENLDAFIRRPPNFWNLIELPFQPWNFKIVVAYPLADAYTVGWSNLVALVTETTLLGLLLILVILWQLRRLVLDPIGTDPALAIAVVQKITEGDLEHDGLTAKSGSLMANVLTMRKKLKKTLSELQKHADDMRLSASVFKHAHDGIFITDPEALIVEVNPAFTEISGYSRDEAIGKTPAELNFACNEPQFFDYLWQSAASAGDWKGESHNKRKNGEIYIASLDLFVVRDKQMQVSHYVGVFSDITVDMEHRDNLEHMAYHDSLTQLPNRTLFADRLQQALAHAQRMGEILAVCYFDLDDFKEVNDKHGHEVGDKLLKELANRMRDCLRESDTIARMGGDEFALLLCGQKSTEECDFALDRLLQAINVPFMLDGISASVSASIGYTLYPADKSTPDTLLRNADQAMYQAKLNGGRCYYLFDAEHDRYARGQRQVRERIENALITNEFILHFQPKVNMQSGEVIGMEALIRWRHPTFGLRLPDEFLPQVEHTDFIIHLGEWVVEETLRQMCEWRNKGLNIQVSVNIAARHLMQVNFAQRLDELLSFYPDIEPSQLELEITETAMIEDISRVTQIMHRCKALGVSFALDDFGVGYSSLTYLKRLPIDVIKIDQSFVRDMLDDSDDLALIAGIISLSREFNLKIVAEGVETPEHGVQLLRMGCKVAQGFGIGHPIPAVDVTKWVQAYKPHKEWKLAIWQMIKH